MIVRRAMRFGAVGGVVAGAVVLLSGLLSHLSFPLMLAALFGITLAVDLLVSALAALAMVVNAGRAGLGLENSAARLAPIVAYAVRGLVERRERATFDGHLERCVRWHDSTKNLAIGRESAYIKRNLSLFGGVDWLDEAVAANALLPELEQVIAGARGTPILDADPPSWIRAFTFSKALDEIEWRGAPTGASPSLLLEVYSRALRALGVPMAHEERAYQDFYRQEGMGAAVPIELSPDETQAIFDASHDLATLRRPSAGTLQDGWSRLPAPVQHFVGEVEELKKKGATVSIPFTDLKREFARQLLDEHVALIEAVQRGEFLGTVGPQGLEQTMNRDRALLERLDSAGHGARPENTA